MMQELKPTSNLSDHSLLHSTDNEVANDTCSVPQDFPNSQLSAYIFNELLQKTPLTSPDQTNTPKAGSLMSAFHSINDTSTKNENPISKATLTTKPEKALTNTFDKSYLEKQPPTPPTDELSLPKSQDNIPLVRQPGDIILSNLQMLSQAPVGKAAHTNTLLQAVQNELIHQILVSTGSLDNQQVVKIIFNPQLLSNTELTLQKHGDSLSITFVTSHQQTESFLSHSQTNLQNYLIDKLPNFHEISVNVRTLQENDGQARDGHSKNRFNYQAPEDEE